MSMPTSSSLADMIRGTESVYVTIMQTLGAIGTVLTVWNIYLILRHSTAHMEYYKWVLLNQTFLVSFFGFLMGLLWVPVPLFPVMSGYIRGPLSFLSEKGNLCIMSLMSAAVTSLTINLMYATIIRYASIDQLKLYTLLTTKESAYVVVGFMFICFFIAFLLNFLAGVSSDELIESAKVKYPELVPIFRTETVFGFDLSINKWMYAFIIVSLSFFSIFGMLSSFLFYKLFSALKRHRSSMSVSVFKLELSLFFAIAMQFVIPMVFGVFPIISTIILVIVRNDNMTLLGEVVFCTANVHTILFNLSTTLIIRPYRRVTFLWLRRIYWITVKRQTLSVTISSEAISAKTQIGTRSRVPPPSTFTPVY